MRSYETLEDWLETEADADEHADDLRICAEWLLSRGYTEVAGTSVRTGTVRDALEGRVDGDVLSVLHRLSDAGIVVRLDPSGSDRFIVHERAGEVFFDPNDPEFVRLLDEEIMRLATVLAQGPGQLRRTAARAVGVCPDAIDDALMDHPDPLERLARFRAVFDAVEGDLRAVANVGRVGWRRRPYRWTLSQLATRIAENQTLPLR